MKSREDRAREIMDEIRVVLRNEWDPIGIKDEPRTHDEYDGQVGAIYRLLVSGASEDQLMAHLGRVEMEEMGLTNPSAEALRPVARKLLSLDVKLTG